MFGFLSIHRTESNGMCEVNGSKAKYGNLLKRVKHISSMNHTKKCSTYGAYTSDAYQWNLCNMNQMTANNK